MRLLTVWAVLSFALDQLSKVIVVHWMNLKEIGAVDVLPPLLNFRMGWNDGINFGLFGDGSQVMRWVLIALAVGISGFLIWWAKRSLTKPLALAGAGMVVGGALANALDRVIYGAVADFLNMSCCGLNNPFTFNVADIFIFAGAFAIIIFGDDDKERETGQR
jgi:signal peptidase II